MSSQLIRFIEQLKENSFIALNYEGDTVHWKRVLWLCGGYILFMSSCPR